MLELPVKKGLLKPDVLTLLFAFDPLMAENLVPLGQEFLIKR